MRLHYALSVVGMVIMLLCAQNKGLCFYVKEPKFELESYPKEEVTCNKDELSEECDCYDGTIEGHNVIVQHLLVVPKVKK